MLRLPGGESSDEVINATICTMEAVLIMEQLNELSSLGIAEAVGRKAGGTGEILVFFPHWIFFLISGHIQPKAITKPS